MARRTLAQNVRINRLGASSSEEIEVHPAWATHSTDAAAIAGVDLGFIRVVRPCEGNDVAVVPLWERRLTGNEKLFLASINQHRLLPAKARPASEGALEVSPTEKGEAWVNHGDSGGGCFVEKDGHLYLAGVVSHGRDGRSFCSNPSYRKDSAQPRVAGWIATAALKSVNPTYLKSLKSAKLVPSKAWLGQWETPYSELVITEGSKHGLVVNGSAAEGSHTGQVENQTYTLKGAVASAVKSEDSCELKLYHFGNAIYAEELGSCGGIGITFAGTYFKSPPKLAESKAVSPLTTNLPLRAERDKKEVLQEAEKTPEGRRDEPLIKSIYDETEKIPRPSKR